MSFGGGRGFGGGGAGERDEYIFRWFGPRGSGAFITPGEEWPLTPEKLIKNKWIYVGAVALILLAWASDSK